ncbi:MAG: GNAT family N-acetyltransferase [Thermococci archaeon]|nr:GNAT family N-acetyltransferase [Thermococci archaeon]
MKVKVRKLSKMDEETLKRLIEVYMSGYEGLREYGGEGEDYARKYIRWCWKKAGDGFFVAEAGGRIVGFIVCDKRWYSKYEGRSVGAIHELVIDRSLQGMGVGHALMEAGLRYLERFTDTIELWVGEKNHRAKRFYEEYGFKEAGRQGIWIRMVRRSGNGDDQKEDKAG